MDPSPVKQGPLSPESQPRKSEKSAIVGDQPKPSMPMASNNAGGGGDRNALKLPVADDGLRDWSYGLFDCFADRRTCAQSCCCCCYVYSRNHQRLVHLETHGTPLREPVERFNHDCKAYFWLQCLLNAGWGLQAFSRSGVRRRYGIRGDEVNDIVTSGCFVPCELVQEHREIQLEESSFHQL